MTNHESTVANADLWSRYFQNEWSRWLNPLGVPAASPVAQVADGTAARVASLLTLVAAGPIAWLYSSNTPQAAPASEHDLALSFDDADIESVEDAAA